MHRATHRAMHRATHRAMHRATQVRHGMVEDLSLGPQTAPVLIPAGSTIRIGGDEGLKEATGKRGGTRRDSIISRNRVTAQIRKGKGKLEG